jgi:hypothetical protein
VANQIEILLSARNQTGPAFAAAGAQARALGNELAMLNPAVGGAIGRVEGLAGALGGVAGPALIAGAALAGIAVAGVGASIKLSDTVEQLDRIAARTGVGIEPLQVLRQILEEGGGNAESLTMALSFLNRAIATQDPILKHLGITTKDTFTAFKELATALSNSSDAGKRTEIAYQLLGRGSGELLGNLKSLVSEYGSMDAAMRANGAMITATSAPALRDVDSQVDKLKENWKGLTNNLGTLSAPAANAVVGSLNAMINGTIAFSKAVREQAVGPLEELAAAAAKLRKESAPTESPVFEVVADRVKTADPLAKVNLQKDKEKTSADERATAIKKMTDALVLTGVAWSDATRQAGAYYDLLKQTDAAKFAERMASDTASALAKANPMMTPDELGLALRETRGQVPQLKPGEQVFEGKPQTVGQRDRSEAVAELAAMKEFAADSLTIANVTRDALDAILGGLTAGLSASMEAMVRGTMTLKQGLDTIWRSILSAFFSMISQMIARAIAFAAIKAILGIATGGTSTLAGSAWGAAVGGGMNVIPTGNAMSPAGSSQNSMGRAPTVNNVTIQTFSPRDVLMQYTSPSGVLRNAQTRVALAGEY